MMRTLIQNMMHCQMVMEMMMMRDDFGVEGLDDILKIDGEEGSGKPSKKPATSNRGAKKKPSTRKRDEAHCYINKHENRQWDFKPFSKT